MTANDLLHYFAADIDTYSMREAETTIMWVSFGQGHVNACHVRQGNIYRSVISSIISRTAVLRPESTISHTYMTARSTNIIIDSQVSSKHM
jgi:hypothetical protein